MSKKETMKRESVSGQLSVRRSVKTCNLLCLDFLCKSVYVKKRRESVSGKLSVRRSMQTCHFLWLDLSMHVTSQHL